MTVDLCRDNESGEIDLTSSLSKVPVADQSLLRFLWSLYRYAPSYERRTRIRVVTSGVMGEESGYIGLSTGQKPCFLLIHNRRSMGGFGFPELSEVQEVWESKHGGRLLWKRA